MYRQSQWRRQVFVQAADGHWIDVGISDKWTGGGKKSDPEMYHQGDGTTINLGGDTSRDDGTATYLYKEKIHSIYALLDQGVGSAAVRVDLTPLDDNRMPWQAGGFSMTGKLAGLTQPESGGGQNGGAEIELLLNLDDDLLT